MNKITIKNPAVRKAMKRTTRFLRAPAERPGQRAWALFLAMNHIDKAVESAIRAGCDKLAFGLEVLHGTAEKKLLDMAFDPEIAQMQAEITALNEKIAEVTAGNNSQPPASCSATRRRHEPSGSPGMHARSALRKRGCTSAKI